MTGTDKTTFKALIGAIVLLAVVLYLLLLAGKTGLGQGGAYVPGQVLTVVSAIPALPCSDVDVIILKAADSGFAAGSMLKCVGNVWVSILPAAIAISGTSLPATCLIGAIFTTTTGSGAVSFCNPADTWNPVGPPAGSIIFVDSGTCPSGYTEVSGLNGRTVLGTLAANGNVGTTGGADTITPAGSINTHPSQVATLAIGPTSTLTGLGNHTFTGTDFDNRSAFQRFIGCKKS